MDHCGLARTFGVHLQGVGLAQVGGEAPAELGGHPLSNVPTVRVGERRHPLPRILVGL